MNNLEDHFKATNNPISEYSIWSSQSAPKTEADGTKARILPKSFYDGMHGMPGCSRNSRNAPPGNGVSELKRKIPPLEVKSVAKNGTKDYGGNKFELKSSNGEPSKKKFHDQQVITKPISSLKIITGTIAQILEVAKEKKTNENYLYEIYANLVVVKNGKHMCEKILRLRNESGPHMQALFYETDRKLPENLQEWQLLRCVGSFNHKMRFIIMSISPTSSSFVALTNRLHAICHFTINKEK